MTAPRSRSRKRRPASKRRSRQALAPARPRLAETLLLDLSRDVTARGARVVGTDDVRALIDVLVEAYAPEAPLAAALRKDWLRTRGDKAAHLAIGWAREQIRVALAEALERGRAALVVRADIDADVLAWLWLAACEAIAHEPPSAVGDRADTLAAFLTRA
jgi:hypothetical protein